MNDNELFKYFGTKIIVKWEHEVGDPKRKHKKKRIAKKWLKRYGTWQEYDGACRKGYAIYIDRTMYVSRNVYVCLKDYIKHYSLKPEKVPHHENSFARIRYDT